MKMEFCLIRDGTTATSVNLDVGNIDYFRRWIISSIRGSAVDTSHYHFIAYGRIQDISGTDKLEELTGTITGTCFSILNKRIVTGSHMEFDLEPIHAS